MVEVVTDLEPVAEDGHRKRTRGEAELGFEEVKGGDSKDNEGEEGEENGLCRGKIGNELRHKTHGGKLSLAGSAIRATQNKGVEREGGGACGGRAQRKMGETEREGDQRSSASFFAEGEGSKGFIDLLRGGRQRPRYHAPADQVSRDHFYTSMCMYHAQSLQYQDSWNTTKHKCI